jgi:hypothetical protein
MSQEPSPCFAYYQIWGHPTKSFFVGSLVVVDTYGNPVEYVYSDKMRVDELKQLLYGESLEGYLASEVIGSSILEKLTQIPSFIFVNKESLLSFRTKIQIPVLMIKKTGNAQVYDYIPNKNEKGDEILFERLQQNAIQYDIYEPFNRLESRAFSQFA